jgi:hypothetical protein
MTVNHVQPAGVHARLGLPLNFLCGFRRNRDARRRATEFLHFSPHFLATGHSARASSVAHAGPTMLAYCLTDLHALLKTRGTRPVMVLAPATGGYRAFTGIGNGQRRL